MRAFTIDVNLASIVASRARLIGSLTEFGEIKMNANTIQFRAGTWLEKIYMLGKDVFENKSNKEIASLIGCDNPGRVSQDRKTVAEKTGWSMPVGRAPAAPADDWSGFGSKIARPAQQPAAKPRKQAGSLPSKIEGFLCGIVEEVPYVWEPCHVVSVIEEDSVAWNRFIRRMADLDESMVESFERWLGRGATMSRQASFDAVAEAAARWDRKALAESLARELLELGFDKTPTAILRETWL